MAVILGCLALFFPRLVIILVWLFTTYLHVAYQTVLWPLLGFIFMPLTTLGYAVAWHWCDGSVGGPGIVIVVVAVLIDLGLVGSSAKAGRYRPVRVERA